MDRNFRNHRDFKKKINLEKLSDDQILEFIDSVESGDENYDSDDSVGDPDYVFNEPYNLEEQAIQEYINEMNATEIPDLFVQGINMSLNLGEMDIPVAAVETVETQEPSFSAATKIKEPCIPKKARPPLPTVECGGPSIQPSAGGFTGGALNAVSKDSKELSKLVWRKRSMCLHVNEVAFRGDSSLPFTVKELLTPLDFFNYFFTDDVIELIVEETNRCALEENINSTFRTTLAEIRHYIGITMYMSVYRYPNTDSYWGKHAFTPIQKCMPLKRFIVIKKYLSFQDESLRKKKGEPGYDPL